MKSIFIATPMYGGMTSGIYNKSLLNTVIELKDSGYEVKYEDLYNESLITRARNTLTHLFLKSNYEYLLFIDSDQSFIAEDIKRMISYKKDIIAAAVPMKTINWDNIKKAFENGKKDFYRYGGSYNVNSLEDNPVANVNDPLEVKYVGSGMMLIHRSVFEKLSNLVKGYGYDNLSNLQIPFGETIREYWFTSVDSKENRLLSEDFNFCSMFRGIGGKIYVDLNANVSHQGSYVFSGKIYG
jgi:hypothetical protein